MASVARRHRSNKPSAASMLHMHLQVQLGKSPAQKTPTPATKAGTRSATSNGSASKITRTDASMKISSFFLATLDQMTLTTFDRMSSNHRNFGSQFGRESAHSVQKQHTMHSAVKAGVHSVRCSRAISLLSCCRSRAESQSRFVTMTMFPASGYHLTRVHKRQRGL